MKKTLFILFFLIAFCAVSNSSIIMQPYLMSVSKNSVYVLVETDTPDTVTIHYGSSPSYGLQMRTFIISVTSGSTFIHKIHLSGLNAASQYFYRAIQGTSVSSGYSFRTAVNSGTPFKFVWYADFRTGTEIHGQISQRMAAHNPLFILNGGDVCEFQSYESWKNEFFIPADLNNISNIPFYYTPGNHEGWNDLTKSFIINPVSPSVTQDYYSFDYGDYHFLSINNYVDCSVGSAQYNFIQSDLASTNKHWKIVMCHQPPYCAGGHGNDSSMIAVAENIFSANNVDVVLSGHSHFYQHNLVNNTRYLVIGCAGAPLYEPDTASFVVKSVKDYCYGVFEATTNSLSIKIFNNLDTLLDSLKIIKQNIGIINNELKLKDFELLQNYPNPFNNFTKIRININKSILTKLTVYDLSGKKIQELSNTVFPLGINEIIWNAADYSSGIYFCTLESDNYVSSKKLVLLK